MTENDNFAGGVDDPSRPQQQNAAQKMKGKSGENPLTGRNISDEMQQKGQSGLQSGVVDIDNDVTVRKLRDTPQLVGARNEVRFQ